MSNNITTGRVAWAPGYDASPQSWPIASSLELSTKVAKLEKDLVQALALSGKLIAFVRVNHRYGTFVGATDEQVAEHLSQFVDELDELKGPPHHLSN